MKKTKAKEGNYDS